MKLDPSTKILDLDGQSVKHAVERDGKMIQGEQDMTFASVAIQSLVAPYRDMTAEQSVQRFGLALKLSTANAETEFSLDDLGLIKRLVGIGWPPVVCGRMVQMIEALEAPKQ